MEAPTVTTTINSDSQHLFGDTSYCGHIRLASTSGGLTEEAEVDHRAFCMFYFMLSFISVNEWHHENYENISITNMNSKNNDNVLTAKNMREWITFPSMNSKIKENFCILLQFIMITRLN